MTQHSSNPRVFGQVAKTDSGDLTLDAVTGFARQAEAVKDFKAAAAAWEYVLARFPGEPIGYSGCGAIYRF
jgi:hypothetical protein